MAGTATMLGELQVPVTCAGVAVNPGDIVLADEGGIVVVSPERLPTVLDAAAAVKEAEARLVAKLDAGLMLRDGLNLDEHVAALVRGEASSLRLLP
jgi:regulator of RNase E activity RraA